MTLLVRLDGRVVDPSWSVDEIGLEDLLLAYMAPERLPGARGAREGAAAMAWVTWRQHRHQLLIGLALIVALALAALVTGLPMRTAYEREALSSCLPPAARSGCDIIVRHFQSEFGGRVDVARLPDPAAGARRHVRRRAAPRARAGARHAPVRVDAEP